MKTLLAIALAGMTSMASAQTVFVLDNNVGGRIELTDVYAPKIKGLPVCDGRMIAKAWGKGPDHMGCWTADSSASTVRVFWLTDDQHRTYDMREFRSTDYWQTKYGKK